MRLLVGCLLVAIVTVSAEEFITDSQDGAVDEPSTGQEVEAGDLCSLDQVADILCDICQGVNADVTRESCCGDENVLYQCEKVILAFLPRTDEDTFNEVGEDWPEDKKRAAWSWKKPAANRLQQTMWDLGYRGKRHSTTDRYSWKPANYRMDWYDSGFRGKRYSPMDYDPESHSESWDYDGIAKRGYWDWKPAAYRLDDPYKFDRLGYFGKRSAGSWKADIDDTVNDEDPEFDLDDIDKRGLYPARYDWKPAPYRLDPMWGLSGKRTLWYNRRPAGRYDWKPSSEYGDDVEKRGRWDWKPTAYRLNSPNRMTGLSFMGKRFSIGPGRWNWKPQKSQYKSAEKRGRYDWKPSTGYFGYDFSGRGSRVPGKRPGSTTQFDWKPRDVGKRDRYTQSWKPWKPAAYRMPSSSYGKKK